MQQLTCSRNLFSEIVRTYSKHLARNVRHEYAAGHVDRLMKQAGFTEINSSAAVAEALAWDRQATAEELEQVTTFFSARACHVPDGLSQLPAACLASCGKTLDASPVLHRPGGGPEWRASLCLASNYTRHAEPHVPHTEICDLDANGNSPFAPDDVRANVVRREWLDWLFSVLRHSASFELKQDLALLSQKLHAGMPADELIEQCSDRVLAEMRQQIPRLRVTSPHEADLN